MSDNKQRKTPYLHNILVVQNFYYFSILIQVSMWFDGWRRCWKSSPSKAWNHGEHKVNNNMISCKMSRSNEFIWSTHLDQLYKYMFKVLETGFVSTCFKLYKAYLLLKWMLTEYNLAVLYFVVYPLLWFFFSLLTGRKRLFSAKCATSF